MTEKNKRQMTGLVVSSKRDKTITVLIERKVKHPLYKKIIRRSTKLQAHDEGNECSEGDIVTIEVNDFVSKNSEIKISSSIDNSQFSEWSK